MKTEKMRVCKDCGKEISKNAKVCPNCGRRKKNPIAVIIGIFVVLILALTMCGSPDVDSASSSDSKNSASSAAKEYMVVEDITTMFDDLNTNAMKAEDKYQDKNIEVSGYIVTFDSDGEYITIGTHPDNYEYFLETVQCYITDDVQKEFLMNKSEGDYITVKGEVVEVGEIMGYSLDIEEVK